MKLRCSDCFKDYPEQQKKWVKVGDRVVCFCRVEAEKQRQEYLSERNTDE